MNSVSSMADDAMTDETNKHLYEKRNQHPIRGLIPNESVLFKR